ncbi:MAG: hypothetical protein EZS28_026180 [Streblomastix strix]|uniref:Uncharacterized protein n=1 Tax=Streblomastix strix TaxID=222440 RepID=A0A5J4V791_9EUKA|nr:MAG: hypothetical protein EZS28_026180 [Streblomastix strix]
MKAAGAAKRGLLEQTFNDTQIAALKEILDVKKLKHRDIKYNKELRTLPSVQAYIGTKKNMRGWNVRNVDPDGPQEPLPNFATVHTDKGKLYSMGGYIPKPESKYDAYQEEYIANVPKGQHKETKFFGYMQDKQVTHGKKKTLTNYQRQNSHQHFMSAYVPTMADEFNQTNGGDLWKLKGAYMYVATAAWDVVLRGLLGRIDNSQDWNTVTKETIKQAARIYIRNKLQNNTSEWLMKMKLNLLDVLETYVIKQLKLHIVKSNYKYQHQDTLEKWQLIKYDQE